MPDSNRFLVKLATLVFGFFTALSVLVYGIAILSIVIDPLWRPTMFVPGVPGIITATLLGLTVWLQTRDRGRAKQVLFFALTANVLVSSLTFIVGSSGCRELGEYERACRSTGDCAALSAHRDRVYEAVCKARSSECKYEPHSGPRFTREDVTVAAACAVEHCPKNGRRCNGSTLQTCRHPHGWMSEECPNGCIEDWRDGAMCNFEF